MSPILDFPLPREPEIKIQRRGPGQDFVVLRILGKVCGVLLGGLVSGADRPVRKYAAGGLVPQGGVVIGLALTAKHDPALAAVSDVVVSVVIGTAVINELVGPACARLALSLAKETRERDNGDEPAKKSPE